MPQKARKSSFNNQETKHPLSTMDSCAARQVKAVLTVAFIIGFIFSIIQIGFDYSEQKRNLSGELNRLIASIKTPAATAIWHVEKELARSVADGLLGSSPIMRVKLMYDENILIEKSKEEIKEIDVFSRWLFGKKYERLVPLFSPEDDTDQIGLIKLNVDPANSGDAFIKRTLWVIANAIVRTVLLSSILLVLFYYSFTRPVLAISQFVRNYSNSGQLIPASNINKLKGELKLLYEDASLLIKSTESSSLKLQDKARSLEFSNQILEHASACLMAIDPTRVILHTNAAMRECACHLVQINTTPAEAHTIEGQPIDTLLPENKALLASLAAPQTFPTEHNNIQIGERFFSLTVSSIYTEDTHLGNTIEWRDVTQEHHVKQSLETVVRAASAGDLSRRLETDQSAGHFSTLADSVNTLLNVNNSVITEINTVLKAMAEGNLEKSIVSEYQGDFLELKRNTNVTIEKFAQVIKSINVSSLSTLNGCYQIQQLNDSLQHHNRDLQEQLLHITEDMQSMTHSLTLNDSSARKADALAKTAYEHAQEGANATSHVMQAIDVLSKLSHKISAITDVINDIAFQTNMLSLNAAVEAARAGEQGKGFAVVATEVQNLSLKSSESAKKISDLTQTSSQKVDDCITLINASEVALQHIVQSSKQVSEVVEGVYELSRQQSDQVSKVNGILTHLQSANKQVTNATAQIGHSSRDILDSTESLSQSVHFFKHQSPASPNT